MNVRKEEKRKEAVIRNKNFAKLTFEQQIEGLDLCLGKGVGAVKQRAKIIKKIEERDVKKRIKKKKHLTKLLKCVNILL